MNAPRITLASRRAVEEKVWQASQLEFEDVISEVDDVEWCLPRPLPGGQAVHLAHGLLNRAGRPLGRDRRARMRPPASTRQDVATDLFFAVFADVNEIGMLPHVLNAAHRAASRVAWIVELWTPQLPQSSDYLQQLRGFDHVIVSNRAVVDAVERLSGVPCTYLPLAVDTDRYAPAMRGAPTRTIDVASWGRRFAGTHDPLVRAMDRQELFYHFDTVRGPWSVTDHAEHRLVQARLLQRTRYSIVYRINDEPGRTGRTGGEESLTNRYFEALSSGTVMLGSAPDTAEWDDCFPWPDAIVPIPAPAPEIVQVIRDLDQDPDRLERARAAAVTTFLRRHDWAHRWREVLALVGLEEHPRMSERLDRLESRLAAWEPAVSW
ncbi:MAG: glycosyltransferase [Aeromicrobium sp.]